LGGYTANAEGDRFIECDYWSGQMMQEFYNELQSARGRCSSSSTTSPRNGQEIEQILHTNERPSRGRFHEPRHRLPQKMIEMHISEIGFCSGHSASGVWTDEYARTTVPGLYAAGDMASVPHNYMLGAFVYGAIAGEDAAAYCADRDFAPIDPAEIERERERVLAPLNRPDGIPAHQVEYKTAPAGQRLPAAAQGHAQDGDRPAPLRRDSPRPREDRCRGPARVDARQRGVFHPRLRRNGRPRLAVPHREPLGPLPLPCRSPRDQRRGLVLNHKRAIEPYIVGLDESEKDAYQKLRVTKASSNA
jgi:hypothetical protein